MDDVDDDAHYPPATVTAAASSSSSSSGAAAGAADPTINRDHDASASASASDPDSPDSRGKRRRIDRYTFGFEFAPRLNPAVAAAAAAASPNPSSSRISPEWTEPSTFALLDAWGERFVRNGRRSLRADEWSEVARIASRAASRPPGYYSEGQCRNRLDTLKKKYKKEKEKARLASYSRSTTAAANSSGKWVYFEKMESLMSPPPVALPPPPPPQHIPSRQRQQLVPLPPIPQMPRVSWGIDAGKYVYGGNGEAKDAPGDSGSGGEFGEEGTGNGEKEDGVEYRVLAESIRRFAEVYERMETNKRQQMAEVEQMRKELQRDLEARRLEILQRAQAEIARIGADEGDDEDDEDERLGNDDDDDEDDEDDENGEMDASP